MSISLLDKLAKLEAKASPRPWGVSLLGLGDRHDAEDFEIHDVALASILRSWGSSRSMKEERANASLTTILVNHGLALVEALVGTTDLCCNIRGICDEHEDAISAVLTAMERAVDEALTEAGS